jgi:maltose alpha-D-glucosyltransferase/alpha-amylase
VSAARPGAGAEPRPAGDPLWYKDAIVYQLHVRAFHDSDGDGIGDFAGLTQKLDYLADLGVTALWLLPFNSSPLRDDGYDVASYRDVHPDYGTLREVGRFVREAHRRGLRVITELVVNHTSDQHPWFQRARRAAPGSRWRDFYVWSDDPNRYADARIIFKDFETSNWAWDPVARAYYWHRFYAHQPDLNFDNPAVREAVLDALDFWAARGVDGFRLDAIPYLIERDGTSCENLPETHAVLKDLRRHLDERFPGRMLLAEANQWPEDAVAYFGEGDECHMAFHFPVMPRLFMAMHMEDRHPIVDILEQTPAIPAACQWAVFLRNHDELTLEMVTDAERDYMYRVYADDPHARINLGIRRRLAPLVANNRRRIELLNGLLFSLPGTPVIYYGDEIGMGDNIYLGDRNGVRTPMQWSADRNAGFSRANPQQLYLPVVSAAEYHPEAVNVESQQANPSSLLWWMKRLIVLRKRHPAFGRGTLAFLYPRNRRILAFVRVHEAERILCVFNLSRFVQYVELDLAAYRGEVPVELFGQTPFPPIGDLPYLLTLGPHAFYWLRLEAPVVPSPRAPDDLPTITVAGDWQRVLEAPARAALEAALPGHLASARWFGGKDRRIRSAAIVERIPLARSDASAAIAFVGVAYAEGEPEAYQVPLAWVEEAAAQEIVKWRPQAVVARLIVDDRRGVLCDALAVPAVRRALHDTLAQRRRLHGGAGDVVGIRTPAFPRPPTDDETRAGRVLDGEQSNTSIVYGDRMIVKMFRRLQEGINPDLEIGRFLSERTTYRNTPRVCGALSYERRRGEPTTLGIAHAFVPSARDAWRFTLDELDRYFERLLAEPTLALPPYEPTDGDAVPVEVADLVGPYLGTARLLGRRIGELHVALGSRADDPAFAPEPVGPLYQRSFYQATRGLLTGVLEAIASAVDHVPPATRTGLERVARSREALDGRFRAILESRLTSRRIRTHGDLHLGQILHTGDDVVVLDFEGEPLRSLGERRLKQSPLRDVAGMLRSFHYAAHAARRSERLGDVAGARAARFMDDAARWANWTSAAFVRAYRSADGIDGLLPDEPEVRLLLDVYVLEKALYELRYELGNRPDWVDIPLAGVLELLDRRA